MNYYLNQNYLNNGIQNSQYLYEQTSKILFVQQSNISDFLCCIRCLATTVRITQLFKQLNIGENFSHLALFYQFGQLRTHSYFPIQNEVLLTLQRKQKKKEKLLVFILGNKEMKPFLVAIFIVVLRPNFIDILLQELDVRFINLKLYT